MDIDHRPLALVTGASGGIGLELARLFAHNGFDVLAAAEDDNVHEAAELLSSETGAGAVRPIVVDLATHDGNERLVAEVQADGRLEAMALNAGIGNAGPFVETALDDEIRLIGLNVASPVHLAKRLLPLLVARGSGKVLVTSSVAATMPGPYYATYAASKAFLLSFAEAIRYELKDSGVGVTALMPGPTDTGFFARADMLDTPVAEASKDDPAQVARDGFEALMAGKDKVVAGSASNKLQAAGTRALPEPVKAAAHARLTQPKHT